MIKSSYEDATERAKLDIALEENFIQTAVRWSLNMDFDHYSNLS